MKEQNPNVVRYLGLSLGGAKSDRTCLTVVDYYRPQAKAFVIDNHLSIGADKDLTSDQVLVELVKSLQPGIKAIGSDAPLTLPPCLLECSSDCEGYEKCKKPEVRWMRKQYQQAKAKSRNIKHFTPYSQRPVDLYFRCKHTEQNLLQDETMGANLAPQAVRMKYLRKFFQKVDLIEVWPKLTLFYVCKALKITKQEALNYRNVERGANVRVKILERLSKRFNLFIYDGDYKNFVSDTAAFDSLLCAWVAMLWDHDQVVKIKSDLPVESGWIQIPEL